MKRNSAIQFWVLFLIPLICTGAYPERTVRIIVPLPAGGGNDIMARTVGNRLSAALGQQFVIDNQPGGGGSVGAETAAKAKPDGYVLFLGGVGSHGINPNLHSRMGYDPVRDFAPISLIATVPLVIVVHPSLPANSVKELIAIAKARPGAINFASLGEGSATHLATELFMLMSGTKMTHIPYNKTPPLTELIAGHVQVMFSSLVRMLPQVNAGKLRAIAVTGTRRSSPLPRVPTVHESGVPEYATGSWYGILAPARTPQPVIALLSEEITRAVRAPEIQNRLAQEGAEGLGGSPDEFARHIKRELARWQRVIKAAGIQLD